MTETSKRFVLLSAYESLSEKETFCLTEANFEAVSVIQAKKARILKELQALEDQDSLGPEEKAEFNRRLERLQESEKSNDAMLDKLKEENRAQFKSISKRVSSASQVRKAYGSASSADGSTRTLADKA